MKKTIVAAAVAAVFAAPAMADVSISGQINQEFVDSGADWNSDLNSDIVFKGSEDLGNGLKASFVIHTYLDDGVFGATTTNPTADQSISLSGDFGSVKVGRFEPYTEGKMASIANIDHADAIDLETTFSNTGRSEGGFQYVSPSFNGLTVGVEGFARVEDTAATASDDFDTTSVFAEYSNAGLTVRVAQEENEGRDTYTSVGAIYKMDNLELRVANINEETSAGVDTDVTFVGAKYTMGANSVAFGMVDADDANEDGDSIISFGHALSKQTNVYVTHKNNDDTTDDQTLVGIQHKF